MTTTVRIPTRGPFSLEELALLGFGHRDEARFDGVMRMAFRVDGDLERAAGVEVRQDGQHLDVTVHSDPGANTHTVAFAGTGTVTDAVAAQVARILSCDHDGEEFAQVGTRDPVVAALQAAAPGLRPPLFHSPYEAALWSLVSTRRPRAQAIAVRERLAARDGDSFELAGRTVHAVPSPTTLAQISEPVPGLPADRLPRLRALGKAAAAGDLDVDRLVGLGAEEAMRQMQRLPGIGPFYATLVVVRACGFTDELPLGESHNRTAVEQAWGLPAPLSDEAYTELAETWRPFRTWVALLARAAAPRLAASTSAPGGVAGGQEAVER